MADTRRELSALQTLLADNTAGDISAQDARDVLVSESGSFQHPTSAFASPPSTPVIGDVWMPSDGFCVYRYSGSVWVPWGPFFPFTEPSLQSWSWANQGGATVSVTNGGIYLASTTSAGYDWRMRVKTVPSAPYTVTVAALPLPFFAQLGQSQIAMPCPILLRDSSGGKITTFSPLPSDSPLELIDWSSPASLATQVWVATITLAYYFSPMFPLFWRLQDDNTDQIWSVSNDGVRFYELHRRSRTAYFTADQIGFGVNPYNRTTGISILSWKEE